LDKIDGKGVASKSGGLSLGGGKKNGVSLSAKKKKISGEGVKIWKKKEGTGAPPRVPAEHSVRKKAQGKGKNGVRVPTRATTKKGKAITEQPGKTLLRGKL